MLLEYGVWGIMSLWCTVRVTCVEFNHNSNTPGISNNLFLLAMHYEVCILLEQSSLECMKLDGRRNSSLRSQADGRFLIVEHREQIPEENTAIDLQVEALIRLQAAEAHYSS